METLAAVAVAWLAPYLVKAGEKAAEALGEKAVAAGEKLLGLIKDKLTGEAQREALSDFEANPGDGDNQAVMRKALTKALAADPAFAGELRALLAEAPPVGDVQTLTQTGDDNAAAQVSKSENVSIAIGRRDA